MAPEYSGLWRADTWGVEGGSRFYWYLPSLLFAMQRGQTVDLPAAALGEWSADGGRTGHAGAAGGRPVLEGGPATSIARRPRGADWSNAVRRAISQHFTPPADRGTGARPFPKA
eukprot:gene10323-187_t